jgi:acetyl esterase/lipase
MRCRLSLALLLALAPAALAQPRPRPGPPMPQTGRIRPGPEPRVETGETVPPETFSVKNIPYVKPPHETQELDIWAPMTTTYPGQQKQEVPPRPLIIWVHGGGWIGGNKDHCPAVSMVKDGFVVASINYRLSSEAPFPAQIEDCKAAVRYLRSRAKEYNIDVDRVGVWGASAGGHLVALLGTAGDAKEFDKGDNLDQSSRVQAVCDWFGPTDLLQIIPQAKAANMPEGVRLGDEHSILARFLGGQPDQKRDLAKAANPITYVSKDDPPFLIMHGDKDQLVPLAQSLILQDALKAAGINSTLEVIKDAGHGNLGTPAARQVRAFFLTHLKPQAQAPAPENPAPPAPAK